jgi:hypothetical protein
MTPSGRYRGNCLLFALRVWLHNRLAGRVLLTHWGKPWPHFAWSDGENLHHLRGPGGLSWCRQLWFSGTYVVDYGGEGEAR